MFAPGIPLIGGGGPAASYSIGKSLRTRSSASAYLNRTLGAPTNNKIWTLSLWVKRGQLSALQTLFSGNTDWLRFETTDAIGWVDSPSGTNKTTTPLCRDPAAPMHVMFANDTTQVTSANRNRIYTNGVEVTSWSTNTAATLNSSTNFNSAVIHNIGRNTAASNYFDGLLSEIVFVDGQQLTPSSFGQTDAASGSWTPKKYTGTYGTNGFYLDFSDNSAATAAAIGADRSGNGNNWTPNNISVTAGATMDSLTDTPTNNCATLNPLRPSTVVPSDGNLSAVQLATEYGNASTFAVPAGKKVYAELKSNTLTSATAGRYFGVCNASVNLNAGTFGVAGTWSLTGLALKTLFNNGASLGTIAGALATTDVTQVAIDYTGASILVWMGVNDVWYDSATGTTGNPATGANPTFTITAQDLFVYVSGYQSTQYSNFGQRAWEKTIPSGFVALNAVNLSTPTIKKGTNGFVAVVDTGTNIQATLATARGGWGGDAYLEIFKDRSNAQNWQFRFSDDTANSLASNSTAAKVAFVALTGADNYVAYALRLSTAYGMATGTVAHTNGAIDTITDSVGNTRKLILLKRTDGVGSWFVYHPDVTAGSLLYLEQLTAQTVDASISTVLSNSFVVASALPTGTYRWVSMAETSGFFKLGKYTAAASADGPFAFCNHRPAFALVKVITTSDYWETMDSKRATSNPIGGNLHMNDTTAETTPAIMDFTANGFKVRSAGDGVGSAQTMVYAAFAETPFKFANSR